MRFVMRNELEFERVCYELDGASTALLTSLRETPRSILRSLTAARSVPVSDCSRTYMQLRSPLES